MSPKPKRVKVFIGNNNRFYEDAGYQAAGSAQTSRPTGADRVSEEPSQAEEEK